MGWEAIGKKLSRTGIRWVVAALFTLPMLMSCAPMQTTSEGSVGVDRKQRSIVSSEEVNASAEKAYAEVIQDAKTKKILNQTPAVVARVRHIANRLTPVTAAFRADAPKWKWETNVITSKEMNAWCMPGGKIAVYTGIIERLNLTDDELAAVMGHEMAHALREHGREKMGQAVGVGLLASLGGAVIGNRYGVDPSASRDLISAVGDLAFMRPNSREMESEADRIGTELAARAGYNPHAAVAIWEKMAKASEGNPPEWLSTHPSHASRIAELRTIADRVMPLYQAAKK